MSYSEELIPSEDTLIDKDTFLKEYLVFIWLGKKVLKKIEIKKFKFKELIC